MKQYVYKLFLKNQNFDDSILSPSLYISFDKISALRSDYNLVLKKLKIFDEALIIKENERKLNEGYEQGLYIISAGGKDYFLRLILSDKLIYDVLVYTISDIKLIEKIFFSQKSIKISEDLLLRLKNSSPALILIKENECYRILTANKEFYNIIKYEDWDFANKYQNVLNQIALKQQINNLEKITLYKSNKELITLEFKITIKENLFLLECIK